MKPFAIIIFSFLLMAQSHAASFDCAKASTDMENLICKNQELSRLDDALARVYKQALSQTKDKKILRRQQRNWLGKVRNLCKDVSCIRDAYNERITQLEHHPSSSETVANNFVTDERSKLVIGSWDAGSAAFYGYGFTITDRTIRLEGCHVAIPYAIINIKDGRGPKGMEPWLKGGWHEITLQLEPTGKQAACVAYPVLDFTFSGDARCSAGITLYDSVEGFEKGEYFGWGSWGKGGCRDQKKPFKSEVAK